MSANRAVVRVKFTGQLTDEAVREALDPRARDLRGAGILVVDCTEMNGYTPEARRAFVAWHKLHANRIHQTLIVTDRPLWRMVISAMSMASKSEMHAFATVEELDEWLDEQA